MDAYGLMSGNSAPLSFRVVGMKLPAGADVHDGKVQLGLNQRVQLLGGEQLEVSYGTMTQFVPAPLTLGLSRERTTTLIRLREGPNSFEATLQPGRWGPGQGVAWASRGALAERRVSITISSLRQPRKIRSRIPTNSCPRCCEHQPSPYRLGAAAATALG